MGYGSLIMDINERVNMTVAYKPDIRDYWQTPEETYKLGHGDCEDIAIAKYFACLEAGIPEDELLLVACFENKTSHMVLVCDGVVLNNTRPDTVLCFASGLLPVYGFNKTKRVVIDNLWREKEAKFTVEKWDEVLKNM